MPNAKAYTVKAGDTLWAISQRTFGAGHLWPSIYIFNNTRTIRRLRAGRGIVNPDLIQPGELIYLPRMPSRPRPSILTEPNRRAKATHPGLHGPQALAAKGATQSAPVSASNPAEHLQVRDWAFTYDLKGLPEVTYQGAGFQAVYKLEGTLTLQSAKEKPLVSFSKEGAEAEAEQECHSAFLDFTKSAKIDFNVRERKVSFENTFTVNGHAGAPDVEWGSALDDGAVIKCALKYKPFQGWLGPRAFGVAEFKVVLELRPDLDARGPRSAPLPIEDARPALVPPTPSHAVRDTLIGLTIVTCAVVVFVWSDGLSAPLSLRAASIGMGMILGGAAAAEAAGGRPSRAMPAMVRSASGS